MRWLGMEGGIVKLADCVPAAHLPARQAVADRHARMCTGC